MVQTSPRSIPIVIPTLELLRGTSAIWCCVGFFMGNSLSDRSTCSSHTFRQVRSAIHNSVAYYSPMGGERGSTARQRISGKICCMCSNSLPADPNQGRGERLCAKCSEAHQPL